MAADALEWYPPCCAIFCDKLEEAAIDKLLNLLEKWEDPVLMPPSLMKEARAADGSSGSANP